MDDIAEGLDALIVEVCSPIFSLLTPLQVPENADNAPDDLREQVEAAFTMLERRCFECQIAPEHIRDIKFAMAAFSDEVVLNSRWGKKYDWMSKPLGVEYFGDSAIGQGFFNNLEKLREDYEKNFDIVQLYFSVLAVGFQGKYRLEGYDQLQAYISTLRADIEKHAGKVNRVLADYASSDSKMKSRIAGQQSYWVMAVLFVASVVIMTAVYTSKMQNAIADSAHSIEVMAGNQSFDIQLQETQQ